MQPYQHIQNVSDRKIKRLRELRKKDDQNFDPFNGRAGKARSKEDNTTAFGNPFIHEGL